MNSFQKPSSGNITKKENSVIEFSSYNLDDVLSPFNGQVTNVSASRCNGNIEIKHKFKGDTIYSNFCNVPTILVSRGDSVSTGQKIGKFGVNPIEYSINDGSRNLSTKLFFGQSDFKEKKEREIDFFKKPKDEPYNPEKEKFGKFEKTKGLSVGQQVLADLLGSPLRAMKNTPFFKPGKFFQKSKKTNESVDFENRLLEEIQKIKSLLK